MRRQNQIPVAILISMGVKQFYKYEETTQFFEYKERNDILCRLHIMTDIAYIDGFIEQGACAGVHSYPSQKHIGLISQKCQKEC